MAIKKAYSWKKCFLLTAAIVIVSAVGWAQASDGGNTVSVASNRAGEAAKADNDGNASVTASTAKAHDDSFVIGEDDVLAVNVWKEPEISRAVPVRSDGKISLPLVGEVQASGETPKQLEVAISKKLQNYISDPDVTVIVQEIRSQRFNILGQVVRPGSYLLTNSMTVLDAIALAGGFRDFAKQKGVYVLRAKADGTQERLPFNYKKVIKGKNQSENIKLEPRDTIVVP